MSRLSRYSNKAEADHKQYADTVVENFMGGNSYTLNPLDTLRIIAASSIFGEPQYYHKGIESKEYAHERTASEYTLFNELFAGKTDAATVFTNAIDAALDHDFRATLEFAAELRIVYYMRLNPSVIFVRAMMHPQRAAFNEANPGFMKELARDITKRPDDMKNQFDYYMYVNGSKKGLPSLLKRSWADNLESLSRYALNKYKGKSLIDLVRISHANSESINELMRTGTLKVESTEQTWETLRSAGKRWEEIIETIHIPHMALLRNLRGIFKEIDHPIQAASFLSLLKNGVEHGKQFPFRYWSAYKAIQKVEDAEINFKQKVLDALSECMDIAIANAPKLEGRVASLSDNSGSAWGTCTSEYGTVTVAEIANLSSLITAHQSDDGYVGVFGDRLSMKGVSTREGLLSQLEETSSRGRQQGASTENGIWLFWEHAIREKEHWDTVFIYSDQQAGRGGLYGTDSSQYSDYICGYSHIDVLKLVQEYRRTVNPKVNVFSVQVAGYNNTVLPENLYRGAMLSGWTGKETMFAANIIDTWNSIESK